MKRKMTLTGLFILYTIVCIAQDIITTRDSQRISAKVVEVNVDYIMFKYSNDIYGKIHMFQKKDVVSIVYQDGRIELFQGSEGNNGKSKLNGKRNFDSFSDGREERKSINVGFMMGGGIVGADIEVLIGKNTAVQMGAGFIGFDFSFNYHLKPYINSSFVSLQFLGIGFGPNNVGAILGPMFNFRAKKIFQAGVGWGQVILKGPLWSQSYRNNVSILFNFNIGLYFPL